jgi:hypothetical protein
LFDARRRRLGVDIGGTPFVPTGSEGYGAQGGSKAPRSIARRHRSHAQPALAGEHGEEPPFDATEHRGTGIVWIPTQSARGFRFDAAHHSDMKPPTVPI